MWRQKDEGVFGKMMPDGVRWKSVIIKLASGSLAHAVVDMDKWHGEEWNPLEFLTRAKTREEFIEALKKLQAKRNLRE